ncbi:MAG: hypothetical protein ACREGH_01010 [Minisyncoccia bacterium]
MSIRNYARMLIFFGILSIPGAVVSAQVDSGAASTTLPSAVAVAVPFVGSTLAYGDLISYDQSVNLYRLSNQADDSNVFGVAVQNPPVVLFVNSSEVPVVRSGLALVNVTLENGPIEVGDALIASSIPGKAMRAATSSKNVIGVARESFTGQQNSTTLTLDGKSIAAGTIIVDMGSKPSGGLGAVGPGTGTSTSMGSAIAGCTAGPVACSVLEKINATPLVTLMRYIIAAVVALGSLYLAFRSFMADATNGVISVGRNPRAKTAIQAMVVFNALLAGVIAIAGLGAGLVILFVKL